MEPHPLIPDESAPDHAVLVARAAIAQASSPTALLAQRIERQRRARSDHSLDALSRLFAVQEAGGDAIDGSFHPRIARRLPEAR